MSNFSIPCDTAKPVLSNTSSECSIPHYPIWLAFYPLAFRLCPLWPSNLIRKSAGVVPFAELGNSCPKLNSFPLSGCTWRGTKSIEYIKRQHCHIFKLSVQVGVRESLCVWVCVLQGDSAHLFSLINIYMTFRQSALQIQQRGKAQLLRCV